MWKSHRFTGSCGTLLTLVLLLLAGSACNNDPAGSLDESGPFRLKFSLDASFQPLHAGQAIRIAVVRSADGVVVAQKSGAIAATGNPSFSFDAGAVLEKKVPYEVHYWIDSNILSGTPGVCDPKDVDHQWSVEFFSPTNDVNFTVSHNPALTEDVCSTFP